MQNAKVMLLDYDNGSHIPFFPQNIFYLASALVKRGHIPSVWLQGIHHGPASDLTHILDKNQFDFVGLGFVAGYWQYQKAKEISEAVNKSTNRKTFCYVLGGHGPGAEPEWFAGKLGADAVVVGDGENAIIEVIEDGKRGTIQGKPCEVNSMDYTLYDNFPMDIYRLIRWPNSNRTDFCFPILSSRGCKWHCSFCYRMRNGFYERNVDAIIEEINWLHSHYQINHFQFSDELLMSSPTRTEEICQAILKLSFPIKWDCNGRLNFARPEILQLMKSSGCEYINYGIESLNQQMLNQMGKGLTLSQIYEGVSATLDANISPGLNLIWGFPNDTEQNLKDATDFIATYDPCHELRTIRPVTPYPGTDLYKLAIEKGLLKGPEDFYENKHKNSDLMAVNFTDIPTKECHKMLMRANAKLLKSYMRKREKATLAEAKGMYLEGKPFRGWRPV